MTLGLVHEILLTRIQWEDEDMLAEGVGRLAEVIRRMLDKHSVRDHDNDQLIATRNAAPSQDAKDFM